MYTRLGAFSPLSETTKSELKLLVAALRSGKENSEKEGTPEMVAGAGSSAAAAVVEGGGWRKGGVVTFLWLWLWGLMLFSFSFSFSG